ncbi:carboxypeptidase-like regulatory domain-containing protein [Aegicerativicinus sediminis]
MKKLYLIFFYFISIATYSQEYHSQVIDSKTKEPLAYATIKFGKNQGVITNEEGVFGFVLKKTPQATDSLTVSYMGYNSKSYALADPLPNTLELIENTINLEQVFLTDNPLTAEEVIEKVKERLDKNYNKDFTSRKFFIRKSELNNLDNIDFDIKESTITELNQQLFNELGAKIPKQSNYYREMAGTAYGNYSKLKLDIGKGAELYDKNKDLTADGVLEKLQQIFKENVKSSSYLKIKSGIIGTKVDVDELEEDFNEELEEKLDTTPPKPNDNFYNSVKGQISKLYNALFLNEDAQFDVLEKDNRYRFTKTGFSTINDNPVYIINFEPKGSKDYSGTMYIDVQDFGIVRLDFKNVKRLSNFNLFGIVYRRIRYEGKMLFSKDENGKYNPKYLELVEGSYFKVDRPLKVIEKNKKVSGPRKQNELSMDLLIDGRQTSKYELVVFDQETISSSEYEGITPEKIFMPTYMPAYDPNFWNGFTIMEPNKAIQGFKVEE